MRSHNSKYYVESLRTNTVKSQKITTMFKRKTPGGTLDQDESPEKVVREEPAVESPSEVDQETTVTTDNMLEPQSTISNVICDNKNKTDICNISDEIVLTGSLSNSIDLRQRNVPAYERIFPEFHHSSSENGWFCKNCTSFSVNFTPNRPFATKAGTFGDDPTRRTKLHINSSSHLESVKNKQTFEELAKRRTDVWKLLQESSLSQLVKKLSTNRFIIKSFFHITHLLIKKNSVHIHNFKDIVELIADCRGKEVRTHLLNVPKNANYMSPQYIAKYIDIMNRYMEVPILTSLRQNKFAMYKDETRDITSVEQMTICATFNHNNKISEHFVRLIPISKVIGMHLSAANILVAFEHYFEKLEILLKNNVRFFMMDTTNVNSGERNGLKRLLKHLISLASWIGCGNHKVALCFKHLLPEFKFAALLALWKFFHFHPLALNFMENVADIYDKSLVTTVCPSVTRWTAHDRVCRSL